MSKTLGGRKDDALQQRGSRLEPILLTFRARHLWTRISAFSRQSRYTPNVQQKSAVVMNILNLLDEPCAVRGGGGDVLLSEDICGHWCRDGCQLRWQGKRRETPVVHQGTGMKSLFCLHRRIVGWTNKAISNIAIRWTASTAEC